MMNEMEVNYTASTNWTLAEGISGPAVAVFVGLEFVFSFSINLFIVTHTLHSPTNRRRRARNQKRSSSYFSSTVFLLNIAVANLLMTVLFMLPYVIAAAAGGWIYGSTDSQREATCITAAFVFSYTVSLSLTTLAAISFDRFLSIVKSDLHSKWMKQKLVLAIVALIWVYALFLAVPIFIGNTGGNRNYAYSEASGVCLPWLIGKQAYAIFFSIATLFPIGVIVVTAIWTFVFTKKFILRDYKRRKSTVSGKKELKVEKSVYTMRLRNLIGVFGSLLLSNVIALVPYYVTTLIAFGVGLNQIPPAIYATCLIVFLLSNVTNSLIQLYFRRDTLLVYCARRGDREGINKNRRSRQFSSSHAQDFNNNNNCSPHSNHPRANAQPSAASVSTTDLERNQVTKGSVV